MIPDTHSHFGWNYPQGEDGYYSADRSLTSGSDLCGPGSSTAVLGQSSQAEPSEAASVGASLVKPEDRLSVKDLIAHYSIVPQARNELRKTASDYFE